MQYDCSQANAVEEYETHNFRQAVARHSYHGSQLAKGSGMGSRRREKR